MQKPLVSILINNYNYAEYLEEAINSALNQSYDVTEVIVVDDGSTDTSRLVIAGYQERITAIFKENGGQASAFNAGFQACHGDIVIFLDSDDYLHSECVQKVVEAWDPRWSKVSWRLGVVNRSGTATGECFPSTRFSLPQGDLVDQVVKHGYYNTAPTSGNAFSRRFLSAVLPAPTSFRIAADGYLVAKAPFYGTIGAIEEVLGAYRVHGSNSWTYSDSFDINKIPRYLNFEAAANVIMREEYARIRPERRNHRGFPMTEEHYVRRMVALKQNIRLPAFERDRPLTLLSLGLRASWRSTSRSGIGKLFFSAWFIMLSVAPSRLSLALTNWLLVPYSRPKFLQTFLHAVTGTHLATRRL